MTDDDIEAVPKGKRILVVALHYPPASDAAAVRARNLVRNLQELGHAVRVITTRRHGDGATPPEARALRWVDTENLARRAVRRRQVAGHVLKPPSRWQRSLRSAADRLLLPDLYAPWIPIAAAVARREACQADLVISTGGASAHVVARLARQSRPVIVDIDDLWWRNSRRPSGPIRDHVDRHLERWIVEGATALIATAHEQGVEVERRWGRPSVTILTGFDPADSRKPQTNGSRPSARREIVFAGTLYENFRLDMVLDALSKGRAEHGWTPANIRMLFIGSGSGRALQSARELRVSEFVAGVPTVPREEFLDRLAVADALLLPLYPDDPHHLPGRFFDFVAAGRPMIGVGSGAVPAGRLISDHGLGVVCETAEQLVHAFRELVTQPRPPDLPDETRALFHSTTAQTTLQQLVEAMALPAREPGAYPSATG